MVIRLGLVGEKWKFQKILNVICTPRTYWYKDTKYILLSMGTNQTVKYLGDIKVDITRDSFRYHLIRSREKTAYSVSGLHSRKYKLSVRSSFISEIHAIFCHICTKSGIFNPQWFV